MTSSLISGAAVLTLGLPTTAYAWDVGGHSTSGCSEASGDHNYAKTEKLGGYRAYETWGYLEVSKTCSAIFCTPSSLAAPGVGPRRKEPESGLPEVV